MATIFTGEVLFAFLILMFIIFMIYSAVLMYHWFKYAMSTSAALSASLAYMGGGFFLFFIMMTAISTLL